MPDNFLQLGAVAVIFLFAVKEFFSYLKVKKMNGKDYGNGMNKEILKELQTMNSNHLVTLTKAINDGNKDIVFAIHSKDGQMLEILGEIKGNLNRK